MNNKSYYIFLLFILLKLEIYKNCQEKKNAIGQIHFGYEAFRNFIGT
jgi:hypothetical protein